MIINELHLAELNSPVQTIKARVELYKGSALDILCECGKTLREFSIERTGENKFFGYGICQKLVTVLIDESEEINITDETTMEVSFGANTNYFYPFPKFYITTVERDRETNDLTITAHDILYKAAGHTVADLAITPPYTIRGFALACASLLGVPLRIEGVSDKSFDTLFAEGANFDGTENVRHALDAIAEATQTIYYISHNWELVFKRLDRAGEPVLTIDRSKYFEFYSNGAVTLGGVYHVTELGDNISPATTTEGVTQYVRDNPFWELREDTASLVDMAQAAVGGMTIEQFECEWFGNYLAEIGDKVGIVGKNKETVISYFLSDTLTYDGALAQRMEWAYDENDAETASNPATLGEVINQTYARVDKANQEISLVAGTTEANKSEIAAIKINTDSVSASVSAIRDEMTEQIGSLNEEISEITTQVSDFKLEADNALLEFKTTVEQNGVTKVDTGTGFKFDAEGLTVSKTNSNISTQITEDGMTVSRGNTKVLVADNEGVTAEDLHATTYLIIGNNSQMEDWNGRTACFWIGG